MAPSPHSFIDADHLLKNNGAAYLRVGSLVVAGYDYILTLPAEWRFYKIQRSWRISAGCLLFILLRYISIATLTVSNIGYFHDFSYGACHRYFLVAPAMKAVQTLISQIIMGLRTYNISQRARWLKYSLPILIFVTSALEFFTNLYNRTMVQGHVGQSKSQNCTGGNVDHKTVWIFYVVAIFYDAFTVSVSSYYLLRSTSSLFRLSGFVKVLFYDGLGYLVCLTAANVVNLILYRASDPETQSSGASLGYTVTWILSQRILIHLRDAAEEAQSYSSRAVTRELTSARDISRAMRSLRHLDPKQKGRDRLDDEYSLSPPIHPPDGASDQTERDLDIKVQVEQRVTIEQNPHAYVRETYRKSRSSWHGR